MRGNGSSPGDPLWYKDAILYEARVGAFHDSDGDGIGEFRGLAEKLDYLHDLGVTALWLLPFYPSPLRDDGYDISDYYSVRADSGTIDDFRTFLDAAHRRGLRVITELVLNHTSDQHPWFQRARRAVPGSTERDFYVWSDTAEKYKGTRVIFQDFEPSNWSWDPLARAYYWHRFYAHQPDLNFEHPEVRRAMLEVVDFWLAMGVDGLRLDAVPYLFEREGTNCENLSETHAFLRELRAHVDHKFKDRMLLAEANQWPEEAVEYFGKGDECHMCFHFPIMPRLFMAIRTEDRFPILDILAQTPPIPEANQWALFLRNHDELTLEMVTDEERDYMYRVYALDPRARINLGIRRRLAPLLDNNRRKMELMNALLFSLPGTPVLYYGDEIGMGDNIYLGDRNGVRTPMQWSADRNAGFSRANPQRLYLPVIIDPEYHYESINVEVQQRNTQSFLWWMKRLISLRKRFRAFGRGSLEFLRPRNSKVLAFVRRYQDEAILVVANLSRFVQYVELDLEEFRGLTPVELFGQTQFPRVEERPYLVMLGPHGFYWFSLEASRGAARGEADLAVLTVPAGASVTLDDLLDDPAPLEALLPEVLATRRWFGGKGRVVRVARLADAIAIGDGAALVLITVEYTEGEAETYALPLVRASVERGRALAASAPQALLAELRGEDGASRGYLVDGAWEPAIGEALLEAIASGAQREGRKGSLTALRVAFPEALAAPGARPPAQPLGAEQSNTSLRFGEQAVLKLIRRVEPGINPDLEIGRFLTERARFPHVPPVLGALEYRRGREEPWTLGVLQGYVANQGDAWRHTLDALGRYLDRVFALPADEAEETLRPERRSVLRLAAEAEPPRVLELLGLYHHQAGLLGERTADLHLALASAPDLPAFAHEPFTTLYQRSLYQSMRNLTLRTFDLLRHKIEALPAELQVAAQDLVERDGEVLGRFQELQRTALGASRIRVHGDYHLGQVLWTGKDFVIIDFEGEPARPLGERRLKRSPLRDVASMLRSFHYAAYSGLRAVLARETVDPARADLAVRFWQRRVGAVFVRAYIARAAAAPFLPRDPEELRLLLDAFLLEKAVYEISYELNHRPAWVGIPLEGVRELLDGDAAPGARS